MALITDMDQPLGLRVGNALEVEEVLEVLRGGGPEDLRELCLELAAWMFHLGGRATTVALGKKLAGELIKSGHALEKFRQMVVLQGGDPRVIDDPARLPRAKSAFDVASPAKRLCPRDSVRSCGHGLRDSWRRAREKGRFRGSGGRNHPAQESSTIEWRRAKLCARWCITPTLARASRKS